jgi:lysophospholipase L1-like esterase
MYTDGRGYGSDFGTLGGEKATPFYFSVAVPEGNYKVTVTIASRIPGHGTTVKAESRRLMLENIITKPGEFVKKSFIVNIKNRKINATDTVKLKARELTKLDWDEKLTLEFDQYAVVRSIEVERAENQITVFLAGNSTVVNQDDEPWASWGQMIPRFFGPGVAFANHAESGLTLGSFLSGKRLDKIISIIKPGDYLFIEFGHNDQKDKGPNDGAYRSYSDRLRKYVSAVKEKGGIPVILTSTTRRSFNATGKIENSLGDFPDAARKVAKEAQVALIDLNLLTTKLFDAMGEAESKKAFVHFPANSYPGQDKALADNTHFSTYGAYEVARCVIVGMKDCNLPLTKFLIQKNDGFDPAYPDLFQNWSWPASLRNNVVKPDGN